MDSRRNKTFAMIFLGPKDTQETWSASQKSHEVEGAPRGGRARPLHYGPLGDPLTQILLLYIHIYSKTLRGIDKNTFPPPQPSVPMRSHLGAFSSDLPEGYSINKGIYVNPIALPMKREQFTSDLRVHGQQLDGFFSLYVLQYHVLLDVLGVLSDVIFFCGVFVEIR